MDHVFDNLHYVPILGFSFSAIGILVPYCISVYTGDVPAFLPYISDAGGDPPQSIIFGFFLGLVIFTGIVGFYLKYLIVKEQNINNDPSIEKLNRITFSAAAISALGLFLVILAPTGHLRRDGSWYFPIFVPHMLGAACVFGVGYVISFLHLILTAKLDPNWRRSTVFYLRTTFFTVGATALILTSFHWPVWNTEGIEPKPTKERVYPEGTLITTISEWIMVFMFQSYVLTYLSDFKSATMTLRIDLDQNKDKKKETEALVPEKVKRSGSIRSNGGKKRNSLTTRLRSRKAA